MDAAGNKLAELRPSSIAKGRRCTPVSVTSADGGAVRICKEDLMSAETPVIVQPTGPAAPICKRVSKHGRCLGRPRGSSPSNVRYATKRGRSPKAPSVTSCPTDARRWVDVVVGGGKHAKRCRCTAPGNKRYLKSQECK